MCKIVYENKTRRRYLKRVYDAFVRVQKNLNRPIRGSEFNKVAKEVRGKLRFPISGYICWLEGYGYIKCDKGNWAVVKKTRKPFRYKQYW